MDKALLILIPLYFAYIIGIGLVMFKKRFAALKRRDIEPSYFKDYQQQAPYELALYKNHFDNQFQLPIVFFCAIIFSVTNNQVSILTVILSYLFVISRFFHSYCHVVTNNLKLRGPVYFLGAITLLILWIEIFTRLVYIS